MSERDLAAARCDCGYFEACECIRAGTVYEDREAPGLREARSPDSPAVASEPTQGAPAADVRESEERLMPIERRVQLRQGIALGRLRDKLVVLSPDELEELLNGYEHGRFRTNG